MVLKENFMKLARFAANRTKPTKIDVPDDVTTDKFLRSLRRQRRLQKEEVEKEMLKKQIANFNKDRTKRLLFGIKGKQLKKPGMIKSKGKKKKQTFFRKANL